MDIDKSKILCPVNSLVFQDTFFVPTTFTQLSQEFSEEILIQTFREATEKYNQTFFNTCFKLDVSLQNQDFLVNSSLFTDETQSIISMMSRFLGLDIHRYVTESLMSLLIRVTTGQVESGQSCCIKFDEFLAESIQYQLVNFHNTRFFRFQSYLIKMFLFFNEENYNSHSWF